MQSEKPLEWAGSSKKDLMAFPSEVRQDMGYALGLAQLGAKHPAAKPWHGEGPGVLDMVESSDGNAFRAVCAVRFAQAVYVLHCFQKKSPSGIKTAQTDVELVHQRLQAARNHYEEHCGDKKA